jgi:RimJ/RimL family protein N-acetyltransferase
MSIIDKQTLADVTIREACPDDAAALLGFFLRMEEKFDLLYEPGERARDSAPVRHQLGEFSERTNCLFIVALKASEIVGFLSIEGGRQRRRERAGYLIMSVREDCHGQGIGRALLQSASEWAVRTGMIRVELVVLDSNPRARHLYEKMGFIAEGHLRDYLVIRDQPSDAVLMAKYFRSAAAQTTDSSHGN